MTTSSTQYIQGETGPWEVIIGLEVHAQVASAAKLFSGASTKFGADANYNVGFLDAGMPGVLPQLNKKCVELAIRTGLGLHCNINLESAFDRKHYFYADLPLGYQISQFYHPLVGPGYLEIEIGEDNTKRINIDHIHLEIDAGKSIHDLHPKKTLIDLNRAGVALMEIVSCPDMRSSDEAMAFVKKLRGLLRHLETCDGNMEQGNLRADVNVSLHRPDTPFGTRAEIKNINSVRFIGQAIEYEITRQLEILEDGGAVIQETRLFDPSSGQTRAMRKKEHALDYRYFPDPDIPTLKITQAWVDEIRAELPELPDVMKQRFMQQYGLKAYDAGVLVSEREIAQFYEALLAALPHKHKQEGARIGANWVLGELFAALNKDNLDITQSKVSAPQLAELVTLLLEGTISGRIAKDIFPEMWATGNAPGQIVEAKGLMQVSDEEAIRAKIVDILKENADKVKEYQNGKDKLFGFFVGQVMKAMAGKANPQVVNDLLQEELHNL